MMKEEMAKAYADGFSPEYREIARDAFLCGYEAKCDSEKLNIKDLDEAAKEYEHNRVFESELENYSIYLDTLEDGEEPKMKEPSKDTVYLLNGDIIDAFKAGAEWRDAQIPKLPDNVDEAAASYFIKIPCSEEIKTSLLELYEPGVDTFKAGAEWAFGQGVTVETVVTNEVGPCCGHDVMNVVTVTEVDAPFLNSKECGLGDKVVVQVRKK